MRYFLNFSYFGKAYHGWQRQPNAITVQEVLEDAMNKILRTEVTLMGAGRTDTGVHARKMVAHFDVDYVLETTEIVHRLNAYLPEDIAITSIIPVHDDAHARFDAVERTYEYWMIREKNPFYKDSAYYLQQPLDLIAMNKGAQVLKEFSDFKCFSRSKTSVKTYICKIYSAQWEVKGDLWVFTITADRFLRNMVRSIVGTLLEIGMKKLTEEDLKTIIKSRDRGNAGVSVPAKGLYLTDIRYPKSLNNSNG